ASINSAIETGRLYLRSKEILISAEVEANCWLEVWAPEGVDPMPRAREGGSGVLWGDWMDGLFPGTFHRSGELALIVNINIMIDPTVRWVGGMSADSSEEEEDAEMEQDEEEEEEEEEEEVPDAWREVTLTEV